MGKTTGKERLEKSKDRRRRQNRERAKKFYEKNKKKEKVLNRKTKNRIVDRVKAILPSTPEKRADILETLIESPETAKCFKNNPLSFKDQRKQIETATAALSNVKEAISAIKHRSDDARTAVNIGISMVCGNNVGKESLAKEIGISRRRIAMSLQHRKSVLSTETTTPWTFLARKTRNDAIPEEHRSLAYDFWTEKDISRPTGNKRDVCRKRIEPLQYLEHEKLILEKTQTEVYQDFKQKYPDIVMGQRYFENCKPFYVVPARLRDRNSCCCRAHVEIHMLFNSCMKYRRSLDQQDAEVYPRLTALLECTLCSKPDDEEYHNNDCIFRQCDECGTSKFVLLPSEVERDSPIKVKWERFEYVTIGEKRKLQIVAKETSPGEMFDYFIELLEKFPAHQFRAQWQNKELRKLIENLPEKQVCCIHDYSENYTCQHQDQIQSLYFGQTQVSIHVTVLHRHAIEEIDGEQSCAENPTIVTEHLFVISPDTTHDSHSVHTCRSMVDSYLKSINCDVEVMHEWTDGCATQYKSRHCLGDVSMSSKDFGYMTTYRNYFETSHAKGPQDGAGANLKHKCDMAVIRKETLIQNALDLYNFAEANFKDPSPGRYQSENVRLKRRVFFYVENTDRNRPNRFFKEVKGIRAVHSVKSGNKEGSPSEVSLRPLTCYCRNCMHHESVDCLNKAYVPEWGTVLLEPERSQGDQRMTRAALHDQNVGIADLATTGSVVAIASADRGTDYYLLEITQPAEILKETIEDDWACRYPAGANVVKGYFFEDTQTRSTLVIKYRINREKLAVVYAATVRYICREGEIDQGFLSLPICEHEDILGSLYGF